MSHLAASVVCRGLSSHMIANELRAREASNAGVRRHHKHTALNLMPCLLTSNMYIQLQCLGEEGEVFMT